MAAEYIITHKMAILVFIVSDFVYHQVVAQLNFRPSPESRVSWDFRVTWVQKRDCKMVASDSEIYSQNDYFGGGGQGAGGFPPKKQRK